MFFFSYRTVQKKEKLFDILPPVYTSIPIKLFNRYDVKYNRKSQQHKFSNPIQLFVLCKNNTANTNAVSVLLYTKNKIISPGNSLLRLVFTCITWKKES